MATFSLRPPNFDSYSDEVISAVILRARPIHRHFAVTCHDDNVCHKPEERSKSKSSYKPRAVVPKTTDASNRQHAVMANRERARLNQARYRKKQRKLTQNLENDISERRKEIEELKVRQYSARIGIPTTQNLWVVATEYFRIFQFGFQSPRPELLAFVMTFLRKVMAPDVSDGSIRGVEALLENWELFSFFFDNFHVHLERLENCGVDSMIASTTTSITLSTETLRRVFPHLVADGEKHLAKKLQGQRIVMRGSVRFDWDGTNDCVARMQSQSDMLTPILHLLGNLEDVSRVFDNACVTPDFRVAT